MPEVTAEPTRVEIEFNRNVYWGNKNTISDEAFCILDTKWVRKIVASAVDKITKNVRFYFKAHGVVQYHKSNILSIYPENSDSTSILVLDEWVTSVIIDWEEEIELKKL